MKVGIDMSYTQNASVFEGIGNYSFSLVTHLLQQPDVDLYYFQPTYAEMNSDTFKDTLSRFITDNNLDVFLLTSPMELLFPEVLLFEQFPKVRFAAIVYDLIPALYPEIYLQDKNARQSYFLQLTMLRRMDLLLTISEHTRKDLLQFGFAPDSIVTIGVGCEDFFKLPPEKLKQPDQFPGGKPFVLAFSPADFRKNAMRLIEAFGRTVQRTGDVDLQLVFVNYLPEPLHDRIKKKVAHHGLSGRVHFLGRVTKSNLLQLYNLSHAVAFPSLYEGAGLPVVEAMCCGVPVLTSTTSSLPEMAGEAAVLVDPESIDSIEEGLTELCFNKELREWLVASGFVQVQQFKWNLVVQRMLAGFRRLTNVPISRAEGDERFINVLEKLQLPNGRSKENPVATVVLEKKYTQMKLGMLGTIRKEVRKQMKGLYGFVNKRVKQSRTSGRSAQGGRKRPLPGRKGAASRKAGTPRKKSAAV